MLNSKIDIFFRLNEELYNGLTIRATYRKAELFYHYPWGSKTHGKYGAIGEEDLLDGFLPDHISFHTDGNIHSKARDGKKKKIYNNTLNPGLNVFDLKRGHFLPILIESFNIAKDFPIEKRFKKVESIDRNKSGLFDINGLNSFSILLISKCARVNPEKLLKDHGFENLTIIGSPLIMADIFKSEDKIVSLSKSSGFSTQLLIVVVKEIWEEFSNLSHKKLGLGKQISVTVCMPPMPLIGKMKNYNTKS